MLNTADFAIWFIITSHKIKSFTVELDAEQKKWIKGKLKKKNVNCWNFLVCLRL